MTATPGFFPVFASKQVQRPNIPGRVAIEPYWHKSMEAGRMMESSIGDAIYNLKEAKKDLEEKVNLWEGAKKLAIDGKLPTSLRKGKYAINVKNFLKKIKKFINEITKTIQSLVRCIALLTTMLNQVRQMTQQIANAISNMIAEVCNWNLPDLPSIPYLLGGLSYGFPGFNLLGINFKQQLKFDLAFTFPQCQIKFPDIDIFRNYRGQIKIGDLALDNRVISVVNGPVSVGGKTIVLPISQELGGPVITQEQMDDDEFVKDFLSPTSNTPFITYTFNPKTDINGSLPARNVVVNSFTLDPDAYAYHLPTLAEAPYTLERVVDTKDPHIAFAWISLLKKNRDARKGVWIQPYQQAYDQLLSTSLEQLSTLSVPYYKDSPTVDCAFVSNLDTLLPSDLWKLSFVEASLLGMERSTRWDIHADTSWFDFSAGALDFQAMGKFGRTETLTLDFGPADYPQTILLPASHLNNVKQSVALASRSIQTNESWRSQRPQCRFIYDQYGSAQEVDRFSQFWREWKLGFDNLMTTEAAAFILSYPEAIDSAVNPLGDDSIASYIRHDFHTRNHNWYPGQIQLEQPTPIPEIVIPTAPTPDKTGWVEGKFRPDIFLSRPDIKSLPITVQCTMMDLNQAYSDLMESSKQKEQVIQAEIDALKAIVSTSVISGFSVVSDAPQTIKAGDKLIAKFPVTEVDIVDCVTQSNYFTIRAKGQYEIVGDFEFSESSLPSVRSVELWINGESVTTATSFPSSTKSLVQLNYVADLQPGDFIQVKVYHQGMDNITLLSGAKLACFHTDMDALLSSYADEDSSGGTDPGDISGQYSWEVTNPTEKEVIAGINLGSLTAVYLNSDGKALPIHPELNVATVPYFDGLTLKGATTNTSTIIALAYGSEYKINSTTPPAPQPQQLGLSAAPTPSTAIVDGTEVVINSDGPFIPGQLIYAGAGGVLSQDFTEVKNTCRWIVVVGKATAKDSFLYQPHLPIDQQGGGGGGVLGTYTHVQTAPSSTWTINHNLGRYVNVEVYDADGDAIVRDLSFVDLNTVVVRLVADSTGHAACS